MRDTEASVRSEIEQRSRTYNEMMADASKGTKKEVTRRGAERTTDKIELYCQDPQRWPERQPQINWAGTPMPLHRANLHFLIAGLPGTGKTISFRMLMQSVFATDAAKNLGGNDRAIIYDPKQEFYPILRGMGVSAHRLLIMNPFDARCVAWDLAADYTTPAEAFQLAKTIIPCPENSQQPFFPKSAAAILTAVIITKQKENPGKWDLADVIYTCMNTGLLVKLLESNMTSPYCQIALNVFGSNDTRNNVMAELSSQLFEYMPIAARWRKARRYGRAVSLKEFIKSPDKILLLGANQTYSEAIQTINRLLIKRLSEITLDHTADGQWEAANRTWLILDELRELGKVNGLGDMINKGRSRGVCAVLGFQDYPGLKQTFGQNVAHEITATCGHKLYLKLGGDSAEWASKAIGKSEIAETHISITSGSNIGIQAGYTESVGGHRGWSTMGPSGGSNWSNSKSTGFSIGLSQSTTTNVQVRETHTVFESEIAHLPGFEEGGGLTGFMCKNAADGKAKVHRLQIDKSALIGGLMDKSDDPGFLACSDDDQDLGLVMERDQINEPL